MVNGVASTHYAFDQRALGEDQRTQANGELWVASQGGYLVKLLVKRQAKAEYFGRGIGWSDPNNCYP